MNYRLTIQYDGTRYNGWQRQNNTSSTIQGKLEAILTRMAGCEVEIQGSGRTDAGVHALAQVANVHLPDSLSLRPEELLRTLNQYLPADIAVTDVSPASERFHARLNARQKTYRYRLGIGPVRNVFERNYICPVEGPLDLSAMNRAAGYLKGEHDFRSFQSNPRMKKSTIRRIDEISICEFPGEVRIDYTGNGFLYNMVRILTGTLVEIGQGKRSPEEIPSILHAKNRQAAGITMPPGGLILLEVRY